MKRIATLIAATACVLALTTGAYAEHGRHGGHNGIGFSIGFSNYGGYVNPGFGFSYYGGHPSPAHYGGYYGHYPVYSHPAYSGHWGYSAPVYVNPPYYQPYYSQPYYCPPSYGYWGWRR